MDYHIASPELGSPTHAATWNERRGLTHLYLAGLVRLAKGEQFDLTLLATLSLISVGGRFPPATHRT